MEQLKTQRHDTMTFGELVDGIGAKIGVGIENAGGAAALEIDGRTVSRRIHAGENLAKKDYPIGGGF